MKSPIFTKQISSLKTTKRRISHFSHFNLCSVFLIFLRNIFLHWIPSKFKHIRDIQLCKRLRKYEKGSRMPRGRKSGMPHGQFGEIRIQNLPARHSRKFCWNERLPIIDRNESECWKTKESVLFVRFKTGKVNLIILAMGLEAIEWSG